MNDATEQRILICAPLGRDAELTANVLESAGLSCLICKDMNTLVREIEAGAGAVLVVEEILPPGLADPLEHLIRRQPGWSDLPILVLTKPGANSPWIPGAYERLGNLTLLERPVRTSTLLSAVRSSLRARQRQYEVRKATQRKDEFLAMLGHELRNPLAPIGSAAQILRLSADDPERVKRASDIISRQVHHMTGLIEDLLDMARVTRGLIELERKPVDIRQILSEAIEQSGPLMRARRHHMLLHLPPEPAVMEGDRKRLIQVITNVINNAAKYTPEGGTVAAHLTVSDDDIVLEVKDNGIGMSPEVVSMVFELFAQAERTSDRSQGGLGLGLSLVKSLVESHGGKVKAASEGHGKGSTFTISLPKVKHLISAQVSAAASEPAIPKASSPLRVMVVDDNVDAANTMEMLLEVAGYDVSVLHTSASAIDHAVRNSPQVCLLDIGLPDMDGTQLVQHLQQMPHMAGAVFIAVTGYGQKEDRQKTGKAGFTHHFVKPVDTAQLLGLLAELPA